MDDKTIEIAERLWDAFLKESHSDDSIHLWRHEFDHLVSCIAQQATASMFTESDLEEAWCAGVGAVDKYGTQIEIFEEWIKQYRKEKHGARSQSGNVEA